MSNELVKQETSNALFGFEPFCGLGDKDFQWGGGGGREVEMRMQHLRLKD